MSNLCPFSSAMPFDWWDLPVSCNDTHSKTYNHLQITGHWDLIASERERGPQPRVAYWVMGWGLRLSLKILLRSAFLKNYSLLYGRRLLIASASVRMGLHGPLPPCAGILADLILYWSCADLVHAVMATLCSSGQLHCPASTLSLQESTSGSLHLSTLFFTMTCELWGKSKCYSHPV